MNSDVKVVKDDYGNEVATIMIRSFGIVTELRFHHAHLDAVAVLNLVDLRRLFDRLKEMEHQRAEPDSGTIASIEHIRDRFAPMDLAKARLTLQIELELPIAASGSVMLKPG